MSACVRCVCVCVWVPDVFAEHPDSGGVEQQPGDEEQQVEVGVHLVHVLVPALHVIATSWGGVDHVSRHVESRLNSHRHLRHLSEENELNVKDLIHSMTM